jgi:hypothetical protein
MLRGVILTLLLLLSAPLSGCFGDEETMDLPPSLNPFDFVYTNTTWYHYAGGINADNASLGWNNLSGNNTPFPALATYYGIGATTFEPTIGVTSRGGIHFSSYGGTGSGSMTYTSMDQGQTWNNMGPFNPIVTSMGQVPSSNDPYIYVDPWTDRLIKFDMHALTAMFVEYSDDDGKTWSIPFSAEGYYLPQDHQSIASMPDVNDIGNHEVIYVFCINTGSSAGGPQCSRSLDGAHTWDIQRPGYPIGVGQFSGLHAHVAGSVDGSVYRGNPSCDGPAVYRSIDGGYTWTEHTITTEANMQSNSHEIATAVDSAGGLHAFWVGVDNKPYYANSRDKGDSWSYPIDVAPAGIRGTGYPTIYAGEDGRVAFAYIGTWEDETWDGFMGVITDAWNDKPLITTTQVNSHDDPLDEDPNCGYARCGGFGDFIDIEIDDDGRPWAAMANDLIGQSGIATTYVTGPALYGELRQLPVIPAGGPETIFFS